RRTFGRQGDGGAGNNAGSRNDHRRRGPYRRRFGGGSGIRGSSRHSRRGARLWRAREGDPRDCPEDLTMSPPPAVLEPIFVTRPLLTPLEDYSAPLEGIWESRWLSNEGQGHDALEQAMCEYLRVRHLSLVTNGTLALALAYRALELSGEVIPTPFTSPATVNA